MRKKIGLITISPEEDYQQRLMDGIFSQCEKYDYDVVVVAPLVKISNTNADYLHGELNIYEAINFDLFDGVIVTPVPMTLDRVDTLLNRINDMVKTKCKCPVICADIAMSDYPVIETDDSAAFEFIVNHLVKEHSCKDIAMLAGMEGYPISELRISAVRNALSEHGLKLCENNVFHGDFWYSGGEKTAEELALREKLPDAVICASDTMAIGLTNRLNELGIKVPGDIIVTGFDGNTEAALNTPTVTSYAPDAQRTGALCVNYLHSKIDPFGEECDVPDSGSDNLYLGESCGCPDDKKYTRTRFAETLYFLNRDYSDDNIWEGIDIGLLMESYTSEIFTATTSPLQCLEKIYESLYLMRPYNYFYLCLNENWLDTENSIVDGYAPNMHAVIISDMAKKLHGYKNHVFFGRGRTKSFPTLEMIPALTEEFDTPQVFYFVPVHFNSKCLGYAVLQNHLSQKRKIGIVYRNYIRNINNSLEMSRTRNRISEMSERDMMTGLYNRRGMERLMEEENQRNSDENSYMCIVIDMDGLKFINDNYGHSAGDTGICRIAEAVAKTSNECEVDVRAGGDEFYILEMGMIDEDYAKKRIDTFYKKLEELNASGGEKIPFKASAGFCVAKKTAVSSYREVLDDADVKMYIEKRRRKNTNFE